MNLKKGFRAPDFRIATVGGVSRALHDYHGRPAVVVGWASWDASRTFLPELQKIHLKEKVTVVSIAFDAQGPAFAMRYLKPAGATFEMLIDATCVLSRRWGVKNVPFVVALDAEGHAQYLSDRLDRKSIAAAVKSLRARPLRKGPMPDKRANDAALDVRVQGCGIFLSRGKTAEAAESLARALELDPENRIIRRQIEALLQPERVY